MTIDLATIHLDNGAHNTRTEGLCLLEAVAWFAGESHTDDKRQQLTPLIPRLPGTADDGHDETRSYMALDWLIRVYTPTWLDVAGLVDAAVSLRELPPVVDLSSAKVAGEKVRRAGKEARAAGDAARDAARDALAPTVTQLQNSAITLYTNMINPTTPN